MNKDFKTDKQTLLILEGLEKAYIKLVAFKKYKNSPLIIAADGVITEIHPDNMDSDTKYTISSKHKTA